MTTDPKLSERSLLIAGEPVGGRTLMAAVLILGSVVLVTRANARRGKQESRATVRQAVPRGFDPGAEKPLERCA